MSLWGVPTKQSLSGKIVEDCATESPEPVAEAGNKAPVAPSSPTSAKSRPKPPYRKAGSVETVSTAAEAASNTGVASDSGTAVDVTSTGVPRNFTIGAESPQTQPSSVDDQAVKQHLNSLFDQMVSKHKINEIIEDRVAKYKINELIEERVAAKGIEGLVEQSLEARDIEALVGKHAKGFLERRLSDMVKPLVQKDVEVMIEANMATREALVKAGSDVVEDAGVEAETRDDAVVEALVKAQFAVREKELEQKVSDRVQGRLQTTLQEQLQEKAEELGIPVSLSRPPTTPRPFSSNHQAKSSPQNKAAWSSRSLYTIAAVPNDPKERLTHASLEEDVTRKVVASQPDRSALGYSETIMRDIANSTVREIVGIFESLLDRLLIEKKQDTLRSMVAELVTEDTHKLWATGSEQLRQKEYGNLHREIERLGFEAREREDEWEKKFLITSELQDSLDDLYATLDERLKALEDRVSNAEETRVLRSELDDYKKEMSDNLTDVRNQVTESHGLSTSTAKNFAEFSEVVKDNYVLSADNFAMEVRLKTLLESHVNNLDEVLKDLQETCATKAEARDTQEKNVERFTKTDTRIFEAHQGIGELRDSFKKSQKFHEDVFVTKTDHNEVSSRLEKEAETNRENLQRKVDVLEANKASKRELTDVQADLLADQRQASEKLTKTSENLDRVTAQFMELEKRIDQTMATRDYVEENTTSSIQEAIQASSDQEELNKLWKELGVEKDRVRQALAQNQHLRKDFTEAVDLLHKLKSLSEVCSNELNQVSEGFQSLDRRESQHFNSHEEALFSQKRGQEDLQEFYKALKEEFMSHKEFSRAEAERIKKHSTERYLEQIDKALNLTQSVEQVKHRQRELNDRQRELNDSMGEIKLPKIVDKGTLS
mmetsp:Transcript_52557/g.91684  ORF Transcript_52557/g.91684 Transcript_52557/m.91684 type:complete len:887 (+) Transcript_52557:83-2743(+)